MMAYQGVINLKPGNKNPGSVSRLFRKMIAGSGVAEVPCQGCTACCRSKKLFVDLRPDELEKFPDAVWEPTISNMVLPKDENGVCVHLVDDKCSIYDSRPHACKSYDCRVHLLVRVFDTEDQPIFEAVKQWDLLKTPTVEDQVLSMAVALAIMEHGEPPSDVHDAWQRVVIAYHRPGKWEEILATASQMRRELIDMPEEQKRQFTDALVKRFGKSI